MKKVLKLIMITSLASLILAGCSSKDTQNESSVVIINAGDSTSKKEDTSESTSDSNKVENKDNTSEGTESTETSEYEPEVDMSNAFYGVFMSNNGHIVNIKEDNSIICLLDNSSDMVQGTYETDWKTYIKVSYFVYELNENYVEDDGTEAEVVEPSTDSEVPTEEETEPQEMYIEVVKDIKITINSITNTANGKKLVLSYNGNKNIEFNEHTEQVDNSNVEDSIPSKEQFTIIVEDIELDDNAVVE